VRRRSRFAALPGFLLAVLVLLAAVALVKVLAPDVPRFVGSLADVVVYVEAKTNWSYDAVTNYVVVTTVLVLLVAERALRGLTRFLLTIVMLLPWIRGAGAMEVRVPSETPDTRWVWTALIAWVTSVAAVHIFD
jgi:hypothetical protein